MVNSIKLLWNLTLLSSRDDRKRSNAAHSIRDFLEIEASSKSLAKLAKELAVKALIPALKDNDFCVRWDAVQSLGLLGDVRATEALIESLMDEEHEVRLDAVTALGKIGDKRAVEPLIQMLTQKPNYTTTELVTNPAVGQALAQWYIVRFKAVEVLGDLGDCRAVVTLVNVVKFCLDHPDYSRSSEYATSVATALAKLRDPQTFDVIVSCMKICLNKNFCSYNGPMLPWDAVRALAKWEDSRVGDFLKELATMKKKVDACGFVFPTSRQAWEERLRYHRITASPEAAASSPEIRKSAGFSAVSVMEDVFFETVDAALNKLNEAIRATGVSELVCQRCHRKYRLGIDAVAVTLDDVLQAGRKTLVLGSVPENAPVMIGHAHKNTLQSQIASEKEKILNHARLAGWWCEKCGMDHINRL